MRLKYGLFYLVLSYCFTMMAQDEEGSPPPPFAEQQHPASDTPAEVTNPDEAPAPAEPAKPEIPLLNGEKPLPEPVAMNRYDTVFARNPFLIKTTAPPIQQMSFAEDWELRGYYSVRGKETAIMFNKKENKSARVTVDEHKDYGLKLLRADPQKRRSQTTVTIGKGTENHTFNYPESPTASAAGGQPGMSNPTVPTNLRAPARPNIPVPSPGPGGVPAPNSGRRVILPNPAANASPPNYGVDSNRDGIPDNMPNNSTLNPSSIGPGSTPNIPSPISRRRRLLLPPPTPTNQNSQ